MPEVLVTLLIAVAHSSRRSIFHKEAYLVLFTAFKAINPVAQDQAPLTMTKRSTKIYATHISQALICSGRIHGSVARNGYLVLATAFSDTG